MSEEYEYKEFSVERTRRAYTDRLVLIKAYREEILDVVREEFKNLPFPGLYTSIVSIPKTQDKIHFRF